MCRRIRKTRKRYQLCDEQQRGFVTVGAWGGDDYQLTACSKKLAFRQSVLVLERNINGSGIPRLIHPKICGDLHHAETE